MLLDLKANLVVRFAWKKIHMTFFVGTHVSSMHSGTMKQAEHCFLFGKEENVILFLYTGRVYSINLCK